METGGNGENVSHFYLVLVTATVVLFCTMRYKYIAVAATMTAQNEIGIERVLFL